MPKLPREVEDVFRALSLMRPRAVLFDVDGTLAETEGDGHRIAFNRAFAEAGLPWVWDHALYGELLAVTGGRERIAHYARQHDPQWLARADSDAQLAQLHQRKNMHYAALVASGAIALRPGVAALFDALRAQDVALGLVTTTSRANIEVLLAAAGRALADFAVVVAGEDVQRKKPDPEAYRRALQYLQRGPTEAVAVEDSRNGLLAALGAGIPTVIVRSQYTQHEDFHGARAVFDQYATAGQAGLTADDLLAASV